MNPPDHSCEVSNLQGHNPGCTIPDISTISRLRGVAASVEGADAQDGIGALARRLLSLAPTGLARSYRADDGTFVHTARLSRHRDVPGVMLVGTNLRYTAIAALGLSQMSLDDQRRILAGGTAAGVVARLISMGATTPDPGAGALTLWAAAELGCARNADLEARVIEQAEAPRPMPTVDLAWSLTAMIACGDAIESESLHMAARRLGQAQHDSGIFPHLVPESGLSRLRRHVGCFADQVYPIQALARYHSRFPGTDALERASACANRVVELQGSSGQWWWHYDARTGKVVEGFPVYSVHQHAMAPMALLDLYESGGPDHRTAIATGLRWIAEHPEATVDLVAADAGFVWRSIRRREPASLSRYANAGLSAIWPGLRMGAMGAAFPPTNVDFECRPYELGWLLYAWLGGLPPVTDHD